MDEDRWPTIEEYRKRFGSLARLPEAGRGREEVRAELEAMAVRERDRWWDGYVSGVVYHGGDEHTDFLSHIYAQHATANPLHHDLFPGAIKCEAEIVSMTAGMLGADRAGAPFEACGTVSSGGSESIALAVKAYRDHARATRGVAEPQMVLPASAHPAFDKAGHNFGVEVVRVPVGPDWRADVAATERALTDRTILVVGSAPPFPHGIVDPVEELSELARGRGIGFHTDACLGGFILPWAERLGHDVPPFDFRLPGVTSISADTHKYGFAPKGTSVVLYRSRDLLHHQYFTATDWSGGLYASPGFAGSRPGALVVAAWAAMVSLGERGYLEAARRILDAAARIKEGIRGFPELEVLGDPLFVIAFRPAESGLDVYKVMDAMAARGWHLNGLQRPAAVHLAVTLRHTEPGVANRFLDDLRASVDLVRADPEAVTGLAPIYGMADTLPERGVIADLLVEVMDGWYRLP